MTKTRREVKQREMHGKWVNIIHTEIVKDGSFIYRNHLIHSPEDVAEKILGIGLTEHIIIGKNGAFYSFCQES